MNKDQFELFPSRQALPDYIVKKIEHMGRSNWKAHAVAAELNLSYHVVYKYFKKLGISRRGYKSKEK